MTARLRERLGLAPLTIVALAMLGAPRAIVHDLGPVAPVLNGLLVFVPLAVWVAFVLWRRVPSPLLTLSAVGAVYGVVLGVVHQALWHVAHAEAPELGGNLAGALSPALEAVVLRSAAFGSSVLTGLLTGVATGAVAWLLSRMVPGFRPQ
ncbi:MULTISPECIES: hypothetical protein [Prauserella salsuginis group]|uniref:ABC-type enterobactin transport system permease subunit n=2 Tax=Prauserella salsuginis group TaxID=2893672 RepID=A0A839XJW0_9PSEU|nr:MULTISPECIES: hypothetical protein [Prauserella salsuginis group]MBB3663041.1 ABC-type enterobactin transport system permease subunit [Prauserella sediminis]MCR3721229.1 hypothetical protein [Prauserella flava]MCR3734690.1 hypothetical protein [Prauserella salsuginis]